MAGVFTRLYSWMVCPPKSFNQTGSPEAPDYTDHGPRAWAAFPGRQQQQEKAGNNKSSAEYRPPDSSSSSSSSSSSLPHVKEEDRPVDCFYLNPTTYGIFPSSITRKAYYNAPLDDVSANLGIEICLATQASAFNPLCKIYAPRYRQATLAGVFYATGSRSSTEVMEDRFQALEVAYSDVKKAFEYYLSHLNQGRPFIMAAHSQGTKLMARLLADCVDNNPPVLQRLICAYLIGGGIPMSVFQHDLPSMHASMSPEDVGGCVVGWDTIPRDFRDGARTRMSYLPGSMAVKYYFAKLGRWESVANDRYLATNPLTWVTPNGSTTTNKKKKDDDDVADNHYQHLGVLKADWGWNAKTYGMGWLGRGLAVSGLHTPAIHLKEGFEVQTSSEWDYVVVPRVTDYLPKPIGFYNHTVFGGTYHLQDYALFYFNIQENAVRRIKTYFTNQGLSLPSIPQKEEEEVKEEAEVSN